MRITFKGEDEVKLSVDFSMDEAERIGKEIMELAVNGICVKDFIDAIINGKNAKEEPEETQEEDSSDDEELQKKVSELEQLGYDVKTVKDDCFIDARVIGGRIGSGKATYVLTTAWLKDHEIEYKTDLNSFGDERASFKINPIDLWNLQRYLEEHEVSSTVLI